MRSNAGESVQLFDDLSLRPPRVKQSRVQPAARLDPSNGPAYLAREVGMFEREQKAFARRLPDLLRTSRGKIAVLHASKLVGVYDTEDEAFRSGLSQFGLDEPFLLRTIQPEREDEAPALVMGLIDAKLP